MTIFEEIKGKDDLELKIEGVVFIIENNIDEQDCVIVMNTSSCNCFQVSKTNKLSKKNAKQLCEYFLNLEKKL